METICGAPRRTDCTSIHEEKKGDFLQNRAEAALQIGCGLDTHPKKLTGNIKGGEGVGFRELGVLVKSPVKEPSLI